MSNTPPSSRFYWKVFLGQCQLIFPSLFALNNTLSNNQIFLKDQLFSCSFSTNLYFDFFLSNKLKVFFFLYVHARGFDFYLLFMFYTYFICFWLSQDFLASWLQDSFKKSTYNNFFCMFSCFYNKMIQCCPRFIAFSVTKVVFWSIVALLKWELWLKNSECWYSAQEKQIPICQ